MGKNFEVSWTIEVEAENPQDAAAFVEDMYIAHCESGAWTYEVRDRATSEVTMVKGSDNSC